MAQIIIQREGRKMYVRDFADGSRFTVGDTPNRRRNTEWAIGASKLMRERGEPTARAVTEVAQGEVPLERDEVIVAETAMPTADTRPTTFRGVTPEQIGGKWYVKWHDYPTNQTHSVSGDTPQDCLDRLFNTDHPIALRFIATLPEDETTQQLTQQAPPVPQASAENRVLRPGDGHLAGHMVPERRVDTSSAVTTQNAYFAQWERGASVLQLKERVKTDPAFAQWYQGQQ